MSQMSALFTSPWFPVLGGMPPADEVLRSFALSLALPIWGIALSFVVPEPWKLPCVVLFSLSLLPAFLLLRLRWRTRQKVRVLGNLLEHTNGAAVTRVTLTRAVISSACVPPGMLVLLLSDGREQIALARRAHMQELVGLPPCLGPYLELDPEDFEIIRFATTRPFAQA